ncbi:MAG: DNA polymerase I [candidate division KSB1 bacterium]|nr:DNA polymerase I [candidate division KSB1 bacterium]
MSESKGQKLFLIDGSALAYRSYFAFIQNPLINSRGENTSAIYGFVRTLFKIFDEEKPDYLGVVFDTSEPTFRHKAYKAYKATRQKMPDEMSEQLPILRQVIEALRIPIIEVPGYEADDILATLALKARERGLQVFLVTSDKDLMQLVDSVIKIYNLRRRIDEAEILGPSEVEEKMGVPPQQIRDFLALVGDSSDNIPGVPKVGKKTAQSLLREYRSLDNLLDHLDEVASKSVRESLRQNTDQARVSQQLVTLDTNVPIELDLDQLRLKEPDQQKVLALFTRLEFTSLMDRIAGETKTDTSQYYTVTDEQQLLFLIDRLKRAGHFTFDLETTSQNPMMAEIVGFSFSCEEGEAFYVPASAAPKDADPYSHLILKPKQGEAIDLRGMLGPILTDETLAKNAQNAKYDILVLSQYGIRVRGLRFDTMLASYLLNPTSRQHNLDLLALEHLNIKKIPTSDLIGKGKKQISMRDVPLNLVARYACEDADVTERLRRLFEPRLKEAGLWELFQEVEIPLITVLVHMEETGVALDRPYLEAMSRDMEQQLRALEETIYEMAGERFNINSTQQLAKILFEKLKLPTGRRTKTGYSTDAAVLEKLAKDYELPRKLLEYREISKLKSTYVDALPRLINPRTGRVHTSYNQTVAATGRLSSSDPNLQNIPIRTEIGRQIRRAFIPGKPGWKILDADYSQIELRIMAHLSKDENLIKAFQNGEDVHRATAANVFGVPPEEVTPELRRRAKEINFGIMYGMGVYGLAQRLEITPEEAQTIIQEYFVKYPGVNDFIIRTLNEARQKGYVTTLLNRRRYLPEILSENRRVREFAERTAINTPIQGTAADMIKVAMIRIDRRLHEEKLRSKMIMQVHDELVFEAPEEELDALRSLVAHEMANALKLDVPIKVDIGIGKNWLEAH